MNEEWLKEAERLMNEYASDIRCAVMATAGFDRIGFRYHQQAADESRAELLAHLARAAVPVVQPQAEAESPVEGDPSEAIASAWRAGYLAAQVTAALAAPQARQEPIPDSVHLTEVAGKAATGREVPLRQAAEQFLASCQDGNVPELIDYYESIFSEALAASGVPVSPNDQQEADRG